MRSSKNSKEYEGGRMVKEEVVVLDEFDVDRSDWLDEDFWWSRRDHARMQTL
jgi:hypothetical protein